MKEELEQIFENGANTLYLTINPETGDTDKVLYKAEKDLSIKRCLSKLNCENCSYFDNSQFENKKYGNCFKIDQELYTEDIYGNPNPPFKLVVNNNFFCKHFEHIPF